MTATICPTECLICRSDNSEDAFVCANCLAPMSLTKESIIQEREPCMITVIGDSNVGKTVYLGYLLDMLSRRAGDYESIPKGPFSINLQQNVMGHLSYRLFPTKTPNEVDQWHWAYAQVSHQRDPKKWYDLVMPDMAGEAIATELDAPDSYIVIRGLLEQSAGAMLLIDASAAAMGNVQADFFAFKLLSYIEQLAQLRLPNKVDTPVAVVLCKSDCCPQAFDDPITFAKTNLNRVWNLCESRFQNVAFFAASVIGAIAYGTDEDSNVVSVPMHSAPRGILEPFEWLLTGL
jgi:GTPase SAR1 family protein